jgi:hypothetical protein
MQGREHDLEWPALIEVAGDRRSHIDHNIV